MVMIDYKVALTSTGKASTEIELKELTGEETDEQIEKLYNRLDVMMKDLSEKALNNYGKINRML